MHDALSRRPRLMTVAEFLDWPGDGTGRTFELVDGELRPMSPGSQTHATIQSTLNALVFIALHDAGSPFRVASNPGVITARHADRNMRAPDLGVTCAPDSAECALPDPVVLIEILSPSNAADTWDSVRASTSPVPCGQPTWARDWHELSIGDGETFSAAAQSVAQTRTPSPDPGAFTRLTQAEPSLQSKVSELDAKSGTLGDFGALPFQRDNEEAHHAGP